MAPVVVNPAHVREFRDAAAFHDWLARNHDKQSEVWIRVFKAGSGIASITPKEAIDVVLCWGWIDAIRKGLDEVSFLQRYTPRGRKSIWSKINRDNVERLIDAGRMTEHGLREVDRAKADGRWDRAYGGSKDMVPPPEFMAALRADPRALATYDKLNAQNRFALAFRLGNLKTEAARARNIQRFVEMLGRGETIYPQDLDKPPARKRPAK